MQPGQADRGIFLKRAVSAAGLARFCSASSIRTQACSSRDKVASGQTVTTGTSSSGPLVTAQPAFSPPSQHCCGALTMTCRRRKPQREGLWGNGGPPWALASQAPAGTSGEMGFLSGAEVLAQLPLCSRRGQDPKVL